MVKGSGVMVVLRGQCRSDSVDVVGRCNEMIRIRCGGIDVTW